MAGESYNRPPQGRIIVRGEPLYLAEKTLTESAKAGMLVAIDGNDYKAKKCTSSAKPVGWIGYEDTDCKIRPTDFETPFPTDSHVAVVAGGNFELYALATGALTIVAGDLLASNGDGTLTLAAAGAEAVGIACESKTIAAGAVERIHVKTLI